MTSRLLLDLQVPVRDTFKDNRGTELSMSFIPHQPLPLLLPLRLSLLLRPLIHLAVKLHKNRRTLHRDKPITPSLDMLNANQACIRTRLQHTSSIMAERRPRHHPCPTINTSTQTSKRPTHVVSMDMPLVDHHIILRLHTSNNLLDTRSLIHIARRATPTHMDIKIRTRTALTQHLLPSLGRLYKTHTRVKHLLPTILRIRHLHFRRQNVSIP